MRKESPFFEKGSVCLILKRSRGLGFLTFNKIKKKVFILKFIKYDSFNQNLLSFYQNQTYSQKTKSKNFLWNCKSIANKTINTCACSKLKTMGKNGLDVQRLPHNCQFKVEWTINKKEVFVEF